ncbi:UbiA prenyltransferase family [Ustulina deusta]|nr:UbiA prenyltransferase family [Ustulina deusta]
MTEKSTSLPSSTPWHARLPDAVVPYLQLMRLDRPNGYWYFWYPHAVLVMRGATCTWNDTVDIDFDRKVSRCRNRPLPRGAISITRASIFIAAQTLASVATLMLLPHLCMIYAVPAAVGWFFYPLAKRVTYYPQVVLGFPMAWGVYMGAASMGADPSHLAPLLDTVVRGGSVESLGASPILAALQEVRVDWPITAFYAANVVWTLLYELVYSHQDAAEDTAAGVKNLVLLYADPGAATPEQRFGTMPLLCRLAIAQVLFFAAAGTLAGFSFGYSAVGIAGTAAALATMLSCVRLEEPESCAWWFKVGNAQYAGRAMAVGLVAEYAGRVILQGSSL